MLAVVVLLGMAPRDAAAELPLLSLPSVGMRPPGASTLVGSDSAGVGVFVPFKPNGSSGSGPVQSVVLEAARGYDNNAWTFDAAYHVQLTPPFAGAPCANPDDSAPSGEAVECIALLVVEPRRFNVAAQLGFHVRTATRDSDEAGLGPALGFSMSRRFPLGEAFLGVQGATVLSPSSGRLEVPVRASLGLQHELSRLRFMLVARGGWDDLRQGIDERLSFDASLSVGMDLWI
ncbi:hypothetical protein JY651_46790 [Pyxidicoccus parkwayensis]|uniref:Uncharacterized protein n=1 Tax=Pyxidicoccus parkwayensis TaxID=2813578 RepID=A0ABX7NUF0_9BACT|nr:hypothetical protein [Pyxidicoccus parkwaysis]QSQ22541.1 hypothetical protein JY651_46790 [Pyxidicoccus parkwaysis]